MGPSSVVHEYISYKEAHWQTRFCLTSQWVFWASLGVLPQVSLGIGCLMMPHTVYLVDRAFTILRNKEAFSIHGEGFSVV